MLQTPPRTVKYIEVENIGLVATVQAPSFDALLEHDPTNEKLTIVTPSSICPEEDVKLIKEFCAKFGYCYLQHDPVGGASGLEPPMAAVDVNEGGGSWKGKEPVEGKPKSSEAGEDQGTLWKAG